MLNCGYFIYVLYRYTQKYDSGHYHKCSEVPKPGRRLSVRQFVKGKRLPNIVPTFMYTN